MSLHTTGTGKSVACAPSTGDGLVVLTATVPEGEVVHRALGRGHHTERSKQEIAEGL